MAYRLSETDLLAIQQREYREEAARRQRMKATAPSGPYTPADKDRAGAPVLNRGQLVGLDEGALRELKRRDPALYTRSMNELRRAAGLV